MTAEFDPAVRLETVAAAAGVTLNTLRKARVAGKIPPPDTTLRESRNGIPARAWKLSTIRAWNPAVAERCARLIDLDPIPHWPPRRHPRRYGRAPC